MAMPDLQSELIRRIAAMSTPMDDKLLRFLDENNLMGLREATVLQLARFLWKEKEREYAVH